ncbi:Lrp/AsnC family transcriptional regulator [Candidatus Micrarchaeota archaeon]|nr:Lrp/AsnC family transcriptional regulator [Candidatus Micrarchaeota archaeon]
MAQKVVEIDNKSQQILRILSENCKISSKELSKKTRIPLTTIYHRIKRLNQSGIIKKYSIEIDQKKLGVNLCAYIMASVHYDPEGKTSQKEIAKKIKKLNFVESVDIITGEMDLIIKVRAKNIQQLNKLITEELRNIKGIDKTITLTVLEEVD